MPKVITQDTVDKIAELAGRGYSKAAIARELNLDRATVRKHWLKEEEEKTEEARPSIEEELRLLTKRSELRWDIGEMLGRIGDRKWETSELRKKGQLASERLKFIKDKVEKAKTLDELDSIYGVVKQEREELEPVLDEDDQLCKERLEQEEKERKEAGRRWSESYDRLRKAGVEHLIRVFPCKREFAEGLVIKFEGKYGLEQGLNVLRKLLEYVDWELKEDSSIEDVEALFRECVNIILGNESEKDRIREIMVSRSERILKPEDDLHDFFNEWLNSEDEEEFVEGVLKLNGALLRLADERYMDIEDVFSQDISVEAE